jgi:hypothetical protein
MLMDAGYTAVLQSCDFCYWVQLLINMQEHLIADIAGAARGEGAVAKQGNARLRRLSVVQLREEVGQLKKECEEQRARKVGDETKGRSGGGGMGKGGAHETRGATTGCYSTAGPSLSMTATCDFRRTA